MRVALEKRDAVLLFACIHGTISAAITSLAYSSMRTFARPIDSDFSFCAVFARQRDRCDLDLGDALLGRDADLVGRLG